MFRHSKIESSNYKPYDKVEAENQLNKSLNKSNRSRSNSNDPKRKYID